MNDKFMCENKVFISNNQIFYFFYCFIVIIFYILNNV